MTYREALDFLFGSLPMYQREGAAAYKADLANTRALDKYFGHPHRNFPVIHVAGTNGKGSVSHLVASVLQTAGYRTGLYTSPHLLDFRERIRIDGQPVPENRVTGFVEDHRSIIRQIAPSFFEMSVAMAFDHFARERIDVAVVETGMGGRLDSTNIVDPVASVITNISYDHQAFLGRTLEAIAGEKAGIIKPGRPVVIGPTSAGAERVLVEAAGQNQSPVRLVREACEPAFMTLLPAGNALMRFRIPGSDRVRTVESGLTGRYQLENVATAMTLLDLLAEGEWRISEPDLLRGFAEVVGRTGILGRWQTVGANPRSICDSAHNPAGVEAVAGQIRQTPYRNLHMVWGMVRDKDPGPILERLPEQARYYFTQPEIPRRMEAGDLALAAGKLNLRGEPYPSVESAYRAALDAAGPEDLVFTGGSTFVVADLLRALGY